MVGDEPSNTLFAYVVVDRVEEAALSGSAGSCDERDAASSQGKQPQFNPSGRGNAGEYASHPDAENWIVQRDIN